ncbi:hypothetical protein [Ethanoligenens sp.]|uniref:hypothetical protein n=1 Tax=Ethanoligenens sp. TaxID=2099655 RepID=UPI0039E79FF1
MKMRILKRLGIFVASLSLAFGICGMSVFAATPTVTQKSVDSAEAAQITSTHKTVKVKLIPGDSSHSGLATPSTTVSGNTGTASITWVNSGQIFWSVTPYFPLSYVVFVGEINIVNLSTGSVVRTLWESGDGLDGVDENVYFSNLPSGVYSATLTGGGTDNGVEFTVSSGCTEVYAVH